MQIYNKQSSRRQQL